MSSGNKADHGKKVRKPFFPSPRSRRGQLLSLRRGFTLIELLAVVTIIGLLSTVGMVSYDSARQSSRDAKRVSDAKQLQQALEIYFEYHDGYPDDGVSGPDGLEIGTPETATLSDAGFAPATEGQIFMVNLPRNPEPGGAPYVFRSIHRDGTDCNYPPCDSYAIYFSLEAEAGSLLAGAHALTPQGMVGPEGGTMAAASGRFWSGLDDASAAVGDFAEASFSVWRDFAADQAVEKAAEVAVAPAVTVMAAANLAVALQSVVSSAAFGQYFLFFLTQPILLLTRKRRRHWGTVYNALSHLPEDLVIVRLRRGAAGRVIKSEVTDKDGRFSFIVPAGDFRIEAAKGGFEFPSRLTAGRGEDGPFLDVYHGEVLEVGAEGGVLTPSIPLDPTGEEPDDSVILKHEQWKRLRKTMADLGPVLGGFALIVKPSIVVGVLLVLQVFIYGLFRRVALPPRPKNWGVVFDDERRRPVAQAVVRVFALPYHKLMETCVTDARGRYNFRVGRGKYYLTVSKAGYLKTESDPVDFSATEGSTFIASDMPLRRSGSRESGAGSGKQEIGSKEIKAEEQKKTKPVLAAEAPSSAPVAPPPPAVPPPSPVVPPAVSAPPVTPPVTAAPPQPPPSSRSADIRNVPPPSFTP